MPQTPETAEFDRYAEEYDAALAQGISVSGEDKNFFARGRIAWTAQYVGKHVAPEAPLAVLDYGCGTGSATSFLLGEMGADRVIGVDISPASIRVAARDHADARAAYFSLTEYEPAGEMDGVFTNGVFHHIPLSERQAAMEYVYRSLKPDGWFALWENNWLSPATRYVMSRCPFDSDAIPLTPRTAHTMLADHGGFEIVRTDFLFIFPRVLKFLRPLEAKLSGLPIGTQYQVLCRKKANSG
jgi:SAM-dependent methyltransferase